MTGPMWLAFIVATVITATFYANFYTTGAIEAEFPGTQTLPAAGLKRFFYLLGLRNTRHTQP